LSSVEDIQREFTSVPCRKQDRLPAVRALFEKMGAKPEELVSQKTGGVENLAVRRSASGTETIIIGAHYDFVGGGCGAVDNWSGIVALAHIYRTTGTFRFRKNIVFVAFDREEEGLIGSARWPERLRKRKSRSTAP
jgi:acetylornithine deacetylase/succinyl-diaminopimelate desuccinylase-like protein